MRRSVALFVASVLMFTAVNVSAQSKKLEGLVVGLETGQAIGAVALYQLNENLQIGSGIGVSLGQTQNVFAVNGKGDANFVMLAPQVRFLMPLGIEGLSAVGEGQLAIAFGDNEFTQIRLRAGVQHWISAHFAAYAGLTVFSYDMDLSAVNVGLLTPHLGVQVKL